MNMEKVLIGAHVGYHCALYEMTTNHFKSIEGTWFDVFQLINHNIFHKKLKKNVLEYRMDLDETSIQKNIITIVEYWLNVNDIGSMHFVNAD